MTDGEPIIREYCLSGGVTARLRDMTRHYFGGYYHVRIEVTADLPLAASCFAGEEEYQQATSLLGEQVHFRRILEKMAVPESGIESVRQGLLDTFASTMLPYLSRHDFPERFTRSEFARCLKSPLRR